MTTPAALPPVSLAAALSISLALGACIRPQPHAALIEPTPLQDVSAQTVRFENTATEHAHVYLVTDERQWLLGRVEPGARASLRIPDAAVAESRGNVRLAVLTGERITPRVVQDPRATFTIAQPASALVAHSWTLTQGQITPAARAGTPANPGARPRSP